MPGTPASEPGSLFEQLSWGHSACGQRPLSNRATHTKNGDLGINGSHFDIWRRGGIQYHFGILDSATCGLQVFEVANFAIFAVARCTILHDVLVSELFPKSLDVADKVNEELQQNIDFLS